MSNLSRLYPLKDLRDYIIAFSRKDLLQRIIVINSNDHKRIQQKVLIASIIATNYPEVAKLVMNGNIEEAEKILYSTIPINQYNKVQDQVKKEPNDDTTVYQENVRSIQPSSNVTYVEELIRRSIFLTNAAAQQSNPRLVAMLLLDHCRDIPQLERLVLTQDRQTAINQLLQIADIFIKEADHITLQDAIDRVLNKPLENNRNNSLTQVNTKKDTGLSISSISSNKTVKLIYINEDILKTGSLEVDKSTRTYFAFKSIENEEFVNASKNARNIGLSSNKSSSSIIANALNQLQQHSTNLFVENFPHYISNDRLQREVPIFLHFGVPPQEDLEVVKRVNVYNTANDMQFFLTVITTDILTMDKLIERSGCESIVRKVISDPFISKEEAKYFGIKYWFPGLTYTELISEEVQVSLESDNYSIPIKMIEEKFLSQGNHSAVKIIPPKDINTQELHNQFPGITQSLIDKKVIDAPDRKGICLVGVPGTGKSTFAKVLAKETQSMLIEVDLSNLLHSLVGESEKAADKLFSFLSIVQPAIIFFDEIDKILRNSGTRDGGVSDNIKAKFLKWLDEPKEGQYVIAAANHPEMLAGELTRTGRWDSVYKVLPPPRSIREELVNRYAELYNLPYVKELVDGGEVSNGRRTKRINADLITHSDIATFYKLLREEPTSISDIKIINRLLYLSFNFEQENWMEIYERMNKLALPDIYELEDMYRMEYGIPLLFNETGSQQGNRQQIGFQQSGTFELNL